jgi:phosphoglycolate phosphatase
MYADPTRKIGVDLPLLLFDMDGTLIHVEGRVANPGHHPGHQAKTPAREEMKRLAALHGVPSEAVEDLNRMAHIWNTCRAYAEAKGYSEEETDALMAALDGPFMEEEVTDHAISTLLPDAEETLDALRGLGYEISLVTTASKASVERIVGSPEYGHIGRFFTHMVTRDDCRYVKPRPEPIMRALALHGRTGFVYVGDSDHDAQAAKAAGGPFILVDTRDYGKDMVAGLGPIAVVRSLSELPGVLTMLATSGNKAKSRRQPS